MISGLPQVFWRALVKGLLFLDTIPYKNQQGPPRIKQVALLDSSDWSHGLARTKWRHVCELMSLIDVHRISRLV